MEIGEYVKYALVTLSGLTLFFVGSLTPLMKGYELFPIFALFLLTAVVCYLNKTPIGGLFYGLFTSISFLLGEFLTIVIVEITLIVGGANFLEEAFSVFLQTVSAYALNMASFAFAFVSLGLFFGLLGYIFSFSSAEAVINPPRTYRDYWSSIHQLGKSEKREYRNLDRRFSSWRINREGWWKSISSSISQPPSDLVFLPRKNEGSKKRIGIGDLYDLSSGRMLGNGLVNPTEVLSKYRPIVLKIPELSLKTRGMRRWAFEKMAGKISERLVRTKLTLAFFVLLSGLFIAAIYFGQIGEPTLPLKNLPTFIAIGLSIVTLALVWSWRKKSKVIIERRPDEISLILSVYVVLALLFGFFYQMIQNFPVDATGEAGSWFIWFNWFIVLSVILGLSYIFMHREVEVVNTYFYDNSERTSLSARANIRSHVYKDPADEPFWLKEDNVASYWVIRFMYYWKYELAKVPHPDWERIELWVDASNGTLKWVVSDYHYRELWYRVKGELDSLYVSFLLNFHTPIPIVDVEEVNLIKKALELSNRDLLKTSITGDSQKVTELINKFLTSDFWKKLHPAHWISDFGLTNFAANFSSKLPWRYWRYEYGLEKPERYLKEPATQPEDNPASDDGI